MISSEQQGYFSFPSNPNKVQLKWTSKRNKLMVKAVKKAFLLIAVDFGLLRVNYVNQESSSREIFFAKTRRPVGRPSCIFVRLAVQQEWQKCEIFYTKRICWFQNKKALSSCKIWEKPSFSCLPLFVRKQSGRKGEGGKQTKTYEKSWEANSVLYNL